MTGDLSPFLTAVLVLWILGAVLYAVATAGWLRTVAGLSPLPAQRPAGSPPGDVPTQRSSGEAFERSWGGSRGYDRPADPGAGRNWEDVLVAPTFSRFVPRRLADPRYRLGRIVGLWAFFIIALPLLVGALAGPTGGPSTFTPTGAQRAVPDGGHFVTAATDCLRSPARPAQGTAVGISYLDDATVVTVPPGARVAITYLYGRPLFSPSAPLCPAPTGNTGRVVSYTAAPSGSGFVYLPQPNGTVVTEITVASSHRSVLPGILVGLAALLLVADIVLAVVARRVRRSRYSSPG